MKKLLCSPTLLGLIVACLLTNTFFSTIVLGSADYSSYVGNVAETAGIRVNDEFQNQLALLQEPKESPESYFLEYLRKDTNGLSNLYETFEASSIAKSEIAAYGITGDVARLLEEKCEALQASVDAKAKSGEALDLYLAGFTTHEHNALVFIWRMFALEGALIGVLMVLLLIGYEQNNRTAALVFSLRKGRRLMSAKLLAAMAVGLASFVLVWFASMAIYLALHPYLIHIWHSSVSSAFHIVFDSFVFRPFLTWDSFSLFEYAFAQLGISIGIVLSVMLLGFFIGMLIKNNYLAFFIFLVTVMVLYILPPTLASIGQIEMSSYVINHNPVRLWWMQEYWFTEGTRQYLWPRFETIGVASSLLVLSLLALLGYRHFWRKDLA